LNLLSSDDNALETPFGDYLRFSPGALTFAKSRHAAILMGVQNTRSEKFQIYNGFDGRGFAQNAGQAKRA
jgi:hypothetical protein